MSQSHSSQPSEMASSSAHIAKNKGNLSFKSGNWVEAIGHYTAAILADRAEPTYPLNRAAAYLKLGKHRDAERDCTTVLNLDSKNVKALYRRAQARIALENFIEAEKDLLDGLKIEPANASIKAELSLVKKRQLEASNNIAGKRPISILPPSSNSQSSEASKITPKTSSSHRVTRNVPIEIVDTSEPGQGDFLKPVHSRTLSPPLSQNSTTSSISVSTSQPHVGGGIFRSNGKHTIFRTPVSETTPAPATASPRSAQHNPATKESTVSFDTNKSYSSSPPPPLTHFAFARAWNALPSPQDRYSLLSRISPESLPALFRDSLEPEFLVSMLHTLKDIVSPSTSSSVSRLMCALPSIPRFNTVLLFLSQKEKNLVREVWDAIDETQTNEGRHAWGL